MMLKPVIVVAALGLAVAGCETGAGPKETAGVLLGAAGGALAGQAIGGGSGRIVSTAVGTIAGAYLGQQIGRSLDEQDRLLARRTTYDALESGRSYEPVSWRNPDSGHSGEVTPGPSYKSAQGYDCREYTQTVYIDGRRETAKGTACREPDGTWRVVNN
ncbi:RT0821/Lpp0805 family surface protein [Futiania mangrovi]|uniref:17 kDa surface antigen n=1 Tax=Futiania mangrovi TaxID=2959716 RepID=A0A9J6PDI7_9PROT|nr:RT0821/Lpp0805 family surface protein [Futiania mangrovii]MCP1337461.1 RT0821/Lpp0805 family surface protein [Futiania mangrovii]